MSRPRVDWWNNPNEGVTKKGDKMKMHKRQTFKKVGVARDLTAGFKEKATYALAYIVFAIVVVMGSIFGAVMFYDILIKLLCPEMGY